MREQTLCREDRFVVNQSCTLRTHVIISSQQDLANIVDRQAGRWSPRSTFVKLIIIGVRVVLKLESEASSCTRCGPVQ